MGEDFVGKVLRSCAVKWRHDFSGQRGSKSADSGLAFTCRERLKVAYAQVGRRKRDDGFYCRIEGTTGLDSQKTSHAAPCQNDRPRIGMKLSSMSRIAQVVDCRLCIFNAMRERESCRRSPGAEIVEIENIPTGAANRLGKIEIALVARKSVQQDDGWMRRCTGGYIDKSVEQRTLAWKLEGLHGCGIGFIRNSIGGKSRVLNTGWHGGNERCAEQDGRE